MPEVVSRATRFETPWFRLVSKLVSGLAGGGAQEFFAVAALDYVTVVAITREREVLLVRQYRPAVERFTLEFPSGHVEKGEEPADSARRELVEETGHDCANLEFLGCTAPDTGRIGNRAWCYFADDARRIPGSAAQPEADVEVVKCSVDELALHIRESRFDHAQNLAALLLAAARGKLTVGPGGIAVQKRGPGDIENAQA
jgi:ADP-ribose pyrophosphatase